MLDERDLAPYGFRPERTIKASRGVRQMDAGASAKSISLTLSAAAEIKRVSGKTAQRR